MFVREDGGSTTVAAAVALLVSLSLVFAIANVSWVSSRAADVQAVADAGALAAANVLSGYATAAQVMDAIVLSLGLIGTLTLAIGLVLCAIPVLDVVGPPVVNAAMTVFDARASLARQSAAGLRMLEEALPYLMAANSALTVRANRGASGSYVGVAIPFPSEGASDYDSLLNDDAAEDARSAKDSGDKIDEIESEAAAAKERADEALRRGWLADCGGVTCMRERARSLAGMDGAQNPNYPAQTGWSFDVGIQRARAYYEQRLRAESYAGDDVEEMTRSAARAAFYEYALRQADESSVTTDEQGHVTCDVRPLPAGTQDVRQTSLYTDACWPVSQEPGGATLHASARCPGNTGGVSGTASLADQEAGAVGVCETCAFTVRSLGATPAASTSIDNGFEHYWREFVRAGADYQAAYNEQVDKEREAEQEAQNASDLFRQALEKVRATRVSPQPPGRYGCVCVAADVRGGYSREQLAQFAVSPAELPPRVAVAAATVAKDPAAKGNTVLAGFFDGIVARGGAIGAGGDVLDAIMTGWGDLLVSYGDGYQAFMQRARESFQHLQELGLGNVASWLRDALSSVIELTALEPADLSPKKPVLADTNDVMRASGNQWYQVMHALVMAGPSLDEARDVSSMMSALGLFTTELTGSDEITIATLTIPGTDKEVPIKVDFGWLSEVTAGM